MPAKRLLTAELVNVYATHEIGRREVNGPQMGKLEARLDLVTELLMCRSFMSSCLTPKGRDLWEVNNCGA